MPEKSFEPRDSYHHDVKAKLDQLMPVFAQVCAGDYSAKIPLPPDLDEFFDLYAGVQMMVDLMGRQFKEFKDQLGFSKALLQAQSDLGHGLILADAGTRKLLYVNSALCKICGYTAPELFDAPSLLEMVAPEDRPAVLKNLNTRDYQNAARFVTQIMHKNGPWIHVEVTLKRLEMGGHDKLIAVCRDISETRRLEEERLKLAAARDAALESNRLKSEFVANVSHEIRTPMNAIVGMTSLLMNTSLSDQQKDFAATIKNSCDSLLGIINDILDFSKMEAGRMSLEMHDFSLDSLVESTVDILKLRAHAKGLELNCSLPETVPVDLKGDAGRLRQVLMNLLANAVKFTDKGGISVNVSCENETSTQARIVIAVTDTGIGLSSAQLAKLFQPFAQADAATTRKYGGTGLGLAISKRFIDLMGGEIGAESVEGQGSTFWVKVKFDKQPAKRIPAPVRDEAIIPRPLPRRDQPHVLVAEDNSVNQKVVLLQLQQLGYTADIVSNGLEAIQAMGDAKYDLVLMDCQMPDMDGYTATAKIREKETSSYHVPIIAMTANAMSDDRKKCLQSGMDDYLPKPIKTEDLAAMLGRWNPAEKERSDKEFKLPGGLNNPQMIKEVAQLFLEKAPQYIALIENACEREDWTALRLAAHTMQGGSSTLGLKTLTLLVRRIEDMAYFGRTTGLQPVIDEMVREYDRLKIKIQAVMAESTAESRAT